MFLFLLSRNTFLHIISDRLSLHIHVYEIINISSWSRFLSFSLCIVLFLSLSFSLPLAHFFLHIYNVYFFTPFSVIVLGIRLLGINAFLSFSRVACVTSLPRSCISASWTRRENKGSTETTYAWSRLIDVESISNVQYEMYGEMRKRAFLFSMI